MPQKTMAATAKRRAAIYQQVDLQSNKSSIASLRRCWATDTTRISTFARPGLTAGIHLYTKNTLCAQRLYIKTYCCYF